MNEGLSQVRPSARYLRSSRRSNVKQVGDEVEEPRAGARPALGKVWLVGAGPGEPDLITWRGRELLQRADTVLYDALSHPRLLDLCPDAELVDVGKRYGQRATAQEEITALLLELGRAGKSVVRLKGGDPLVFARGAEEALALRAAGIPFDIVPGVTSPIAAAAFAGISLTHRDLSSSVTFITGSDQAGTEWSPAAWRKLATATGTICILMGMRRLAEIAQAIIDGGRAEDTPVAVIQWAARPEQRTVVSTLVDVAAAARAAGLTSPAVIIVGEVVALREQLNWYETLPLFGRRILVPRPVHQAAATAEAIRRRGAEPLVCPAIEVCQAGDLAALARAVSEIGTYQWVVFTSANGVRAAFEAIDRAGADARIFGSTKLAVIGPRTADALQARGLRADLVATKYVAESLAAELAARLEAGGQVLLLRAAEARDVLPIALRQAGALVDVVPAYETRAVTGEALASLRAGLRGALDVVLLTSSSMVRAIVAALGVEARSLLAGTCVVALGPVTAATCRELGVPVQVEAPVHTVEGALDALEAFLRVARDSVTSPAQRGGATTKE